MGKGVKPDPQRQGGPRRDEADGMNSLDAGKIVTLLPHLRRYARALTGSQKRGDAYVRLCLETILAEPGRFGSHPSKFELFRAFHEGWRAINSRTSGAEGERQDAVQRVEHGLAELPTTERQILLLTSLEGFSLADTAAIVGLDDEEAQSLLDKAQEALQLETSVPIMIIEDEPLIAMDLARIVLEMGHTVCATAARQDQAIELAAATNPALILADIQLSGDGNGIIAVRDILKSTQVPIIFITGYPERLLTGENVEPAFVMTKPFNADAVKMFIGQALTVLPPALPNKDVA